MTENTDSLEEKLREAACYGNVDAVRELLVIGVNVNSKNSMNGWSALHWAAHRNHLNVVDLLLRCGADKTSTTKKGETPGQLTTSQDVQSLLGTDASTPPKVQEQLPITPNYIKNPPMFTSQGPASMSKTSLGSSTDQDPAGDVTDEVVLKVRLAESHDPDFIEIDLPKNELTYAKLVDTCCEELNISLDSIVKIRKLPNTVVRRDKDVARLTNYQEIEVVQANGLRLPPTTPDASSTSSSPKPQLITNRNQYESISLKKDQTVLY